MDQPLAPERIRSDALSMRMEVAEGTPAAPRSDTDALRNRANELAERWRAPFALRPSMLSSRHRPRRPDRQLQHPA
jgi:hypothetical protein